MYELFSNHQNISQLFLIFLYLCDGLSQNALYYGYRSFLKNDQGADS